MTLGEGLRVYSTPPSSSGSTNGTRSVSATKSPNQASAVSVRLASVASSSRARNDARTAAMHAAACAVGSPSRHRSLGLGPSAPASPIASARSASARAAVRLAHGRWSASTWFGRSAALSDSGFAQETVLARGEGAAAGVPAAAASPLCGGPPFASCPPPPLRRPHRPALSRWRARVRADASCCGTHA
eukprot:3721670-Pleurochrysis_carterae.AAC.1